MGDSREMPKYISHKTVWALKIKSTIRLGSGSIRFSFEDEDYGDTIVSEEVVKRYFPVPGDYYVVYGAGYKSISPAKAFEEGYTKV